MAIYRKNQLVRIRRESKSWKAKVIKVIQKTRTTQEMKIRYINTTTKEWVRNDRTIQPILDDTDKPKFSKNKQVKNSSKKLKLLGKQIMESCPRHSTPITFKKLYETDPGFTQWLVEKSKTEVITSNVFKQYLKYVKQREKMTI